MVLPPNKRQKAPKTARIRCPCRLSNPSKCNKLHPPPFAKGGKRLIYFYLARFSHFIDSLRQRILFVAFLLFYHLSKDGLKA